MDKITYWRAQSKQQRREMARKLSVSPLYLDHVFLYRRRPSASLALHIYELTGGQVPVSEFRDDIPDRLLRRRIPAA